MKWKSRHGLRGHGVSTSDAKKREALQFGVRGETYAYWHLRRLGYIFIARNRASSRAKGDGTTVLPELSITPEKHHVLVRTAHYFLRERHIKECPLRFDVVAIDNAPGHPRVVRLQSRA